MTVQDPAAIPDEMQIGDIVQLLQNAICPVVLAASALSCVSVREYGVTGPDKTGTAMLVVPLKFAVPLCVSVPVNVEVLSTRRSFLTSK